ncbi:MAG: hypothetical protein HY843_03920, partial [Bdellovibrio sp.]|nr:hypothetical protein [Bdellovibrio sp.]
MTQIAVKLVLFLVLLGFRAAQADSLSDSEQKYADAQNQYFDTLLHSPPKNDTERKALQEKILKPALMELNQVLQKENE